MPHDDIMTVKELSNLDEFRLMLFRWNDSSLHTLAGTPEETRLRNRLDQKCIAKERATWFKKHVQARAMTGKMAFPPQNMFHIQNFSGVEF